MKYQNRQLAIPTEQRQYWNETIVDCIEQEKTGIEAEEIFNRYTGKGGLHRLDRQEFDNYHQYSTKKKEMEQGQFFTPHALCEQIVQAIQPPEHFIIADLTCGMGNFFNCLPNEENIYGNELEENAYTVCKYLYPKAHIENGDFVYYASKQKFDLIVGNPPFNLMTDEGLSQWYYIRKSYDLLQFGGLLAVIIPDSFLKDTFQDSHKIAWMNERFNFIVQCKIPDNTFEAIIDTKLLILQKKGITNSNKEYNPEAYTDFIPARIYTELIAPVYEQYKHDAPKRHLLTVQQNIDDKDLRYKIRKCLWHIKSNPSLNRLSYKKAMEKIELLTTQVQPNDVSNKDWEHIKVTPEKVYTALVTVLKNQNKPKPQKIVKIVKTAYGLWYKAYHKP